jgi:hypothetical protein
MWAELKKNPIDVDLYRRNLQRAYVDMLARSVENPAADSDLPALARADLKRLIEEIKAVVSNDATQISPMARAHLDDVKTRAEMALDPYPAGVSAPPALPTPVGRRGDERAGGAP